MSRRTHKVTNMTMKFDRKSNASRWTALCGCGTEQFGELSNRLGADKAANKFVNEGWLKRRGRLFCPNCHTTHKPTPAQTQEKIPMAEPAPKAINAEPPMTMSMYRTLFGLLDDYFIVDKGTYRDGHSDASLAKETGLSLVFVKQVRADEYGPLAPNPAGAEIEKLQQEMAGLVDLVTGEIKRMNAEITLLKKKL